MKRSPLSVNMALAEIASSHPPLMRVLDHYGLDYCCGGKRTLAEACRQQGLDLAAVINALSTQPVELSSSPAWIDFTPVELVDHLEATHHSHLKQELPRLSDLAAKVSRVHGATHPDLAHVAALLGTLRSALELHLRHEEEDLFPRIRTMAAANSLLQPATGALAGAIEQLERDHTAVGALLEQLRSLTDGYRAPADTCASTQALMAGLAALEADLHLHVHKENNHLFPALVMDRQQAETMPMQEQAPPHPCPVSPQPRVNGRA